LGNPFCHIELSTEDVAKAKKFYKGIFEWTFMDMKVSPEMSYTGVVVGDGVGGGMATKQGPGPNQWVPYVAVADVKKAIAKAKKGGATIHVAHQEVPNMGFLGIFTDPFGATLGVWQPLAAPPAPKKAAPKKAAKR